MSNCFANHQRQPDEGCLESWRRPSCVVMRLSEPSRGTSLWVLASRTIPGTIETSVAAFIVGISCRALLHLGRAPSRVWPFVYRSRNSLSSRFSASSFRANSSR